MSLSVAALLVLASQAQGAPAPVAPIRLNCRAVAVNGATMDFPFELRGDPETGEARIASGGALIFRLSALSRDPGTYQVTLFLEQDGARSFPIAGGYCAAGAIAAPPPRPGRAPPAPARATLAQLNAATLEAAAEANLPCSMVTPDGRISRFQTYLRGPDRVFEPLDAEIWSGPRRSRDHPAPRVPPDGSVPVVVHSIFSDGEGSVNPTGLSVGYIDPPHALAVGLHQFTYLGTGEVVEGREAFGICAFRLGRSE
ncbi:MAG TPA: hypothetical protein VD887_11895 [Allosphingosinicella sp.]|nr:hypothetical protein [Allosphingosinicella sp.]